MTGPHLQSMGLGLKKFTTALAVFSVLIQAAAASETNSTTNSTITCDAGSYVVSNSSGNDTCSACPAGRYQPYDHFNGTYCNLCPRNTFQNQTASTECWACPNGTTSPEGAAACSSNDTDPGNNTDGCDAGSYFVLSKAGSNGTCAPCPAGQFQPYDNFNGTECTLCPFDSFQNGTGAAECFDCPNGTSSEEGSAVCEVDDSGCFSGEAVALLEDGRSVPVSRLSPGDRVLSVNADGDVSYVAVFRVTHWEDRKTSKFVRITTQSGNVLEVTGNHLLHGSSMDLAELVQADDVSVGDHMPIVQVVSGVPQVTFDAVASIERVKGVGSYNVHTLNGRIVVNGVVATHFTTASSWGKSNEMATAWYQIVHALGRVFGAEDAREA